MMCNFLQAQDLPVQDADGAFDIEIIQDTLNLQEDTLFLDELLLEEEELQPWTFNAGLYLRNRQIQNGVDLSGQQGIASLSTDIYHENGFAAGLDLNRRIGSNAGYQGFNARLGYTYSATDWLDVGAQFTRFGYATDSINPVAGIPNMISFNTTFIFSPIMLDITYDNMFGALTESVKYLSLTIMGMTNWGDLRIMPIASIVANRYTLESKRLLQNGISKSKTYSGLSMVSLGVSFRYPVYEKISLTANPSLLYTPQKTLSYSDFQPTISLGLRYSLDF